MHIFGVMCHLWVIKLLLVCHMIGEEGIEMIFRKLVDFYRDSFEHNEEYFLCCYDGLSGG